MAGARAPGRPIARAKVSASGACWSSACRASAPRRVTVSALNNCAPPYTEWTGCRVSVSPGYRSPYARAGWTSSALNSSTRSAESELCMQIRVSHLRYDGQSVAKLRAVGRSLPRKEGLAKVTGASRYVDDLVLPGMLYGRTIRSSIPCGEIASIRYDFDRAGFTIVDYRDIPGRNIIALIEDDQPCLAEREVRHVAEPIVLLAHADRERLVAANVD